MTYGAGSLWEASWEFHYIFKPKGKQGNVFGHLRQRVGACSACGGSRSHREQESFQENNKKSGLSFGSLEIYSQKTTCLQEKRKSYFISPCYKPSEVAIFQQNLS